MELSSPPETTILYGVFHPEEPQDCLYVGITSARLKVREDAHWASALRGKTKGKFPNWMRKHPELRGVVVFRELRRFETRGEAFAAEIQEITSRRLMGQARLNTASGGEGQDLGFRHTEESRARMAFPADKSPTAKTNWEDVRKLRAEASSSYVPVAELALKYGLCQNAVRNILGGKTWVDEGYDPQDWIRKFVLTPLNIASAIREARAAGARPRELARRFGVSESTVRSIVRNKSRSDPGYDPSTAPTLPVFGTKLNPSIVREIRTRYEDGETLEVLANEFSVTTSNVWSIIKRETWKSVL